MLNVMSVKPDIIADDCEGTVPLPGAIVVLLKTVGAFSVILQVDSGDVSVIKKDCLESISDDELKQIIKSRRINITDVIRGMKSL